MDNTLNDGVWKNDINNLTIQKEWRYCDMSQQHWSNIYWYSLYMVHNPLKFNETEVEKWKIYHRFNMGFSRNQIRIRFKDGKILNWAPSNDFIVAFNEKKYFKCQNTRLVIIEKIEYVFGLEDALKKIGLKLKKIGLKM